MKSSIKKTYPIIIMLFIFTIFVILFSNFPLTGDDWGKHISDVLGAINISKNQWINFNGRFLGNLYVILMKSYPLFKIISQSLFMTLIIYFLYKVIDNKKSTTVFLILILILSMPLFMFRQTISWMSGFANFVPPVLFLLIVLNYFKNKNIENKKWFYYIPLILSGILISLFSEHNSIFGILLSIGLIILSLILNKKIYKIHIIVLISTIIGAVLMFSSPVYIEGLPRTQNNELFNSLSLFGKIIYNLKDIYYIKSLIFDNVIINIGISFLFLVNIKKYKLSTKILSIVYFVLTITIMPLISFDKVNISLKIIYLIAALYLILTLLLIYINFKKEKDNLWNLLFYYLSGIVSTLPLLCTDGFGPRCFLTAFILNIIFVIKLYYLIINKYRFYDILIILGTIILTSLMIYVSFNIKKISIERENIIKNAIKDDSQHIVIPTYTYPLNLFIHQNGIPQGSEFHERVFRTYYGIDDSVILYYGNENNLNNDTFIEIVIPSYDGSNEVTHPSVVSLNKKISGYKYWMAFTPWPKNQNKYENPSLVASNNGINWEVPKKLKNPLAGPPINKYDYYSDPCLIYNDGLFEMWYRFNPYNRNGKESTTEHNIIYRITSKDAINWSNPQIIFDSEKDQMYMSISVIKENDIYYIWYVNKYGYAVHRQSKDLLNWSKPIYLEFENYSDNVWHLEVKKRNNKYEMIFYSNNNNEVLFSTSQDGLNFITPVIIDTKEFKKANNRVYKSTYFENESNIYLYVPYEDIIDEKPKWKMYLKKQNKESFYKSIETSKKIEDY